MEINDKERETANILWCEVVSFLYFFKYVWSIVDSHAQKNVVDSRLEGVNYLKATIKLCFKNFIKNKRYVYTDFWNVRQQISFNFCIVVRIGKVQIFRILYKNHLRAPS